MQLGDSRKHEFQLPYFGTIVREVPLPDLMENKIDSYNWIENILFWDVIWVPIFLTDGESQWGGAGFLLQFKVYISSPSRASLM